MAEIVISLRFHDLRLQKKNIVLSPNTQMVNGNKPLRRKPKKAIVFFTTGG